MLTATCKPMGMKSYGSIPHLIGSKRGEADHGLNQGAHDICTLKARDKKDFIVVSEKLDGACCAVWMNPATHRPVALTRSGHLAKHGRFEHLVLFHEYVEHHIDEFSNILFDGERVVGEWLALAHSTRYDIVNDMEPFVVFDIMKGHERLTTANVLKRLTHSVFVCPTVIHCGGPLSLQEADRRIGLNGFYNAVDTAEGVVYRVEREGKVDFLAKYVRPDKQQGVYLPEISGAPPIWNWKAPWREEQTREIEGVTIW